MTMGSEQVAKLLVELGERTPQIQNIVQEEEAEEAKPRWAIELEDGSVVIAALDTDHRKLSLETGLGRPREEHRLAICEALLMFTSLKHVDNTAMALSEPEGEFRLCSHLPECDFDAFKLQTTLNNFAVTAQRWRAAIARGAPGSLYG